MINIINEPKGLEYFRLLDYLFITSDKFSLTMRDGLKKGWNVHDILESLEDYLIEIVSGEDFAFNNYCDGKVYVYKLTRESMDILKSNSNRLYEWQHPYLPEDLSFFDKDWNTKLITVAHEKINGLVISDESDLIYIVNNIGIELYL